MENSKPIFFMAFILVVVVAGIITYSDYKITQKDDTIQKRDVTICQLRNQIDNTKVKCT